LENLTAEQKAKVNDIAISQIRKAVMERQANISSTDINTDEKMGEFLKARRIIHIEETKET
tara:strand:+ start:6654 stop:6836 length:183 start_codon:yes stop_codon:yes gene_type:complete